MPSDHRRGLLWALAAAVGIASFVIPWKVAASHGGTAINTLLLLTIAAVFNSLLTGFRKRSFPRFRPFDLGIAAALATFTLFGNLASAAAIHHLSPALLTVMQRSEVIIVALLAWPIIGERIEARFWIVAAVAGFGLFLLQDAVSASEPRAVGMTWAAVSAFCFASMAVITRLFIQRIDLVAVNALRLWIAVALWFVFNGFPAEIFEVSAAQAGYVGLAAFFGPFLGRLCMMNSARYIEARVTTLATLAAPPLTLLLATVLLADQPSAREIQGGIVMLIGIAIPVLGWAKQRPASDASASNS